MNHSPEFYKRAKKYAAFNKAFNSVLREGVSLGFITQREYNITLCLSRRIDPNRKATNPKTLKFEPGRDYGIPEVTEALEAVARGDFSVRESYAILEQVSSKYSTIKESQWEGKAYLKPGLDQEDMRVAIGFGRKARRVREMQRQNA